jgi:amino acid permease
MYQATRRYLGTADAETRRIFGSAVAHGRRRLKTLPRFQYERPDTTFFALAGTTLNLLNATTGPGLLALPLAFARCGWLLGTLLLLLVFFLNHASLGLLLRACLTTREHSYIGLCGHVSAATASLIDWSSLAFFFGSSVSYLVIIGEAFTLMTAPLGNGPLYQGGPMSDGPLHYSAISLLLLLLFTLTVLAPLSFLRNMDSLQCTSAAGIFCLLYAVGVILAHGPQNKTENKTLSGLPGLPGPPPQPMFDLSADSLVSLPTLTFCFSSQPLFPPALETLHQPATYSHMNSVGAGDGDGRGLDWGGEGGVTPFMAT